MGHAFESMSEKVRAFIAEQKIFFVGTALADGRVSVSPKGMDSFRVMDENRVLWLNVTGSGNETAAHVRELPRMTIMFAALEGNPMILRLYGTARAIHPADAEWSELFALFDPIPGARQLFDVSIDLVQTSCGMAVPYYDYVGERTQLNDWAGKQGEAGIQAYWDKNNVTSLDGKPTGIEPS